MSNAKKASFALIFAKICQKGIAMISAPIFTRIMLTEQYGGVTNYQSWESIILIIATLNLSMGVFNNGMLDFPRDRDRFMASCICLSNICTCIIFGIYFLFKSFFSDVIDLQDELMILMFLYMLFYPAYSYWSTRQRYEYKYKLLTSITFIISAAQLAMGVVLVLLAPQDHQAIWKVYATQGVLIVVGIITYVFIFIKAHFSVSKDYIKYAFKFNIFLVPHFLAISVLSSGDRIMINSMVGKTATAIYGVSYSAAFVIQIFWQAVEASWTPWLFENLRKKSLEPIKKRANQIVTVFACIAVISMLFAPEIMMVLASKDYYEGIYIIPAVTGGVFFTGIYALYMRIEYYSKRTKATMIGSIAAALINILLNYIFINLFGYIAAGYTTLVCYILLYVFHFFYSRRIGMKDIYDDKFIALIGLVIILLSVLIGFTYNYTYLRYGIITIILILVFAKRKEVLLQIKSILS